MMRYCRKLDLIGASGQNLFTKGDKTSLATMDKQIIRLIGKATTLAASVVVFCLNMFFLIRFWAQDGVSRPPRP
jgi:hypothetical protein